jgi:hypothetical protein
MSSRAKKAKRSAVAVPAAAAAASSVQPVYAIKCSRKSKVLEYDDESFTDCYGPEIDDHAEEIDRAAAGGDGDWLYDMGNQWQHGTKHETVGLLRNAGSLRVFKSKEEANGQAALVWLSLQANHPFPEAPPEEEEEEEEDKPTRGKRKSSSSSSSRGKGRSAAASSSSSSRDGKSRSSSAKGNGKKAAAVDPDSFTSMTADGRASWKREQRFYVDPWLDDELKNLCTSTLTVEVVEAQLVG